MRSAISYLHGTVFLAATVFIGSTAFAAPPIAEASSGTEFQLNGAPARAGVSSWPVMAGDEIRSISSPVVIRFSDGSRMTLSEGSRVKVVENREGLGVDVTGGSAQFNLVPKSALRVYNGGRAVGTRSGVVSTGSKNSTPNQVGGPRPEITRNPPPPLLSSP